jgi:hypothetical protein
MSFYIIERSDQLSKLGPFNDCFVRFIPKSNKYHPALTTLSLVYIRPLDGKKGFILCINHRESFSLSEDEVIHFLLNNTKRLFVLDKKQSRHWFNYPKKLYDVNFIEHINITTTSCTDYYYNKHSDLPNINCLIPISKHYEECENTFDKVQQVLTGSWQTPQFEFNNNHTSNVFYQLESSGLKLDKDNFITYYRDKLPHPEFNLSRGKIYTCYNLYTTTSRPSNVFNGINFAALNKDNGERLCYVPENDKFIELDFQGYHPRLIGELVDFHFPKDRNTYDYLGEVLGVTQQEAKELTFKQLYGGVWEEYHNKPFFEDVKNYTESVWDSYNKDGKVICEDKIFMFNSDMTPSKLLSYIIQSYETSTNVRLLTLVLDYLKDKKTKIVLYTYDAFLFDYSEEDGDIMKDIINILHYPTTIKQGKTYHGLEKI